MTTKALKTVRSLADTPLELSHTVAADSSRPAASSAFGTVALRDRTGETSTRGGGGGGGGNPPSSLPPINNDGGGRGSGGRGSSYELVQYVQPDNRTSSRIEYLEDRLQQQERTTQGLLDRAFNIKEDIIDNLNRQHGSWQEEKHARSLLQEHIRTITDVVKKLSRDIQTVEQQIVNKEQALTGTNTNVKNLELHHVAGVTDLRGRVARCDASISRLAADLKACYDSVKSVSHQHANDHSQLSSKAEHIDSRVSDVYGKLDKQIAEHTMQIQRLESELARQISAQDARTRSLVDELKGRINGEKQLSQGEREKLETRLINTMERALTVRDNKQEEKEAENEKKVDEAFRAQQSRIGQLEEQVIKEREKNTTAMQALESRLSNTLDSHVRRQQDDMRKLKAECREGFSTVHDSITNMKEVMDGKRKLLEEKLQKSIGEVRKMVVLI